MNKKLNTLLFILGATAFNILVTMLFFLTLFVLYARLIMNIIPESGQAWAFPVIFIAAIVLTFLVYRFVIKFLMKKIDIDKYFDPIIRNRYRPPAKKEG